MTDKVKSIHAGHRERIRERLRAAGMNAFSDHEVLELLLTYAIARQDVNPLAHELINTFGSLSAVLDADEKELLRVKGMGKNAALLLTMMPQLMQAAGVTEILKASDPMKWTGLMNSLKAQAEETILRELIYN